MNKSRLFALLLALAMVVSMFAGCGKDNTDTPATDAPATDAPATDAPATDAPATETTGEKIYRTYMSSDAAMLNGHDDPGTAQQTPFDWCNSTLWRAVPNEGGRGYHYIGDLAVDLPELIETKEGTYAKYVAEEQADGTSKQILTEETGTLTTWQFEIREGATWHNGEALTAEDVVYSWKMAIDPVMANQMSNFVYNQAINILNGEKYFRGDCEWDEVGIKVLEDGKTMQITVVGTPEQKTFCSHFTDRSCYVVYEELYEAGMSADRTETTYGASLDSWMGSGPYYFVEWEQDNKHVYKKNPNHWNADLYNYDVVEVYIIKEQNAAVQMFEAGKLDQLTPNSNTIETYIEDPRLVSYSSTGIHHLDINDGTSAVKNENNPIADTIAWRKALYHALDRETIAKQFFGYMKPAGWYVNGQAGLLSAEGLTFRESEYGKQIEDMVAGWSAEGHTTGYNPELARQYVQDALAEKGLPADTKIECILLYGSGETEWEKTGQWLVPQFEEIFQGQVTLKLQQFPDELGTTAAKKEYAWDMSSNQWSRSLSRTYPFQCYYYFTSGYGSHPNYYLSDKFDAQFDYCVSVQDGAYDDLLKATYDLEMIALEEVIHCPVVQIVNYTLFSEHLVLPVDTYIPGFGWGTMYGDIVE